MALNFSPAKIVTDGSIANIKYYNKVLSTDEILENYNILRERYY